MYFPVLQMLLLYSLQQHYSIKCIRLQVSFGIQFHQLVLDKNTWLHFCSCLTKFSKAAFHLLEKKAALRK